MGDFVKGGWKKGLFEFDDPMVWVQTYLCASCTVAQIHEAVGSPWGLNKPLACCLPIKPCQIFFYGQELAKKGGFEETPINAIGKLWCCGLCYLVQQYQQAGGTGGQWGTIIKFWEPGGPKQVEMQ